VPKLRFPEFRAEEAWLKIPLGHKVDLLSGFPFDGVDISQDRDGVRLLRGINITEGTIRHSNEIDRFFKKSTHGLEKYTLCVNDLVIGMDGSKVGKNAALISEEDANALLVQRVARLRLTSDCDIKFIFQQIISPAFHAYVDRINTSSGIPHISANQIREFEIFFPSVPEQRKIAECLSSVDDLIAAQARKVDALKTHKKGLMQQLFPREGETQPRLRFPEFRGQEVWSVKTIGQICKLKAGEFVSASSILDSLNEGLYPCYGGNGLRGYVKSFTHDGTYVLVGRQGALCGNVNLFHGKFHATEHALVATPNEGFVTGWLYYALEFLDLNRFSIGQAQPGLSVAVLNNVSLSCPSDLPEQHRIAACLSTLDDLITAEGQKLEGLKTHKRGLMQQLFPAPEAVEA
jgi:type I restriction enzyme S subunit